MKNLIFFHIDSLSYEGFKNTDERPCPLPFLKQLQGRSLHTENLYSKAPYTEAAIMSLYCGIDTMSEGGYMKKLKDVPDFFYKVLHDNNYEVFTVGQPYVISALDRTKIDNYIYAIDYDFKAFWSYRLYYYRELLLKDGLRPNDYSVLIDLFDDNFKEWILFLERLNNKEKSVQLILENCDNISDAPKALSMVLKEKRAYCSDKVEYINSVLKRGLEHSVFGIPTFSLNKKVKKKETEDFVTTRYRKFINRSFRKNAWLNFKNNKLCLKKLAYHIRDILYSRKIDSIKEFLRYIKNYKESIFDSDLKSRVDYGYDKFKNATSILSHFDCFLDWHQNDYDGTHPYAAFFTIDDIHNEEMFFSYDTDDCNEIQLEFSRLKEYYQKIPNSYRGSLSYDYALVYIDYCMEKIYSLLESRGMLTDSYLVITSDHGFSFGYNPPRSVNVVNFHEESYHVPFMIYGEEICARSVTELRSNVDVPVTILDILGLNIPSSYVGHSLTSSYNQGYVMMEFMGAGCPDLERRPVQFAIRSQKYLLVYWADLNSSFECGEIRELYDLDDDPLEQVNLRYTSKVDREDVKKAVSVIQNRFESLRKNYMDYKRRNLRE